MPDSDMIIIAKSSQIMCCSGLILLAIELMFVISSLGTDWEWVKQCFVGII